VGRAAANLTRHYTHTINWRGLSTQDGHGIMQSSRGVFVKLCVFTVAPNDTGPVGEYGRRLSWVDSDRAFVWIVSHEHVFSLEWRERIRRGGENVDDSVDRVILWWQKAYYDDLMGTARTSLDDTRRTGGTTVSGRKAHLNGTRSEWVAAVKTKSSWMRSKQCNIVSADGKRRCIEREWEYRLERKVELLKIADKKLLERKSCCSTAAPRARASGGRLRRKASTNGTRLSDSFSRPRRTFS